MSYSSEVLADSPVVYLKLDDTSGTTAVDSSGNGRDMTSANCTLTQTAVPPYGSTSSYDFNGTSSQVGIADAAWQRPSAMTVEAWIRPDQVDFRAICGKDGVGQGFAFYIASGKLSLFTNGTGHADTTTTLSTGTTYHVAATFDTGTIKLYVNGSNVATFTSASLTPLTGTNLLVGVSTGSNAGASRFFWFDGRLDEFAMYSTALSTARLLAHYTAGTTSPDATVNAVAATATASSAAPTFSVGSSIAAPAASASASAPTPVVTGTGDATVLAPIASATSAASAPTISASATVASPEATVSADPVVPTVTATANATVTAPVATASADAVAPFVSNDSPDATIEAPVAHATASAHAPGIGVGLDTDVSNVFNGRERNGFATVELTIPVAPAPAGTTRGPKVDKAVPLPLPTLVNGRPT